jgi:predicted ribosomally synthesized peptide with SipW-like signal peptide
MDDKFELSRRKVLGGLGAIGLASAGAGLGTSAYFSDTESFLNNTLTAGSLDLKLDYKSTYVGGPGRLSQIDALYPDFDVEEIDPGVYLTGEVPDVGDFSWPEEVQERDLCDPEMNLVNGDEVPVFNLEDVKPGDAGEVTISLHICDNPSWVWMYGNLTEDAENGINEPESEVDESSEVGELAESIDVTMWYDEDCDNIYEPGQDGEPVCIQLVLDASGSMSGTRNQQAIAGANTLAERILTEAPAGSQVGVTFFSASGYDSGAQVQQTLTDDLSAVQSAINGLPANGSATAIGEGIATAQSDLANCGPDEVPTMLVLTDGGNNAGQDPVTAANLAKGSGTDIYALGVGGANQTTLEGISSDPDEEYVFFVTDADALDQAFGQIAEVIVGETAFFEGTLAEAMAFLSEGYALDGNRSTEARECFAGGLTQCIGFEWELPAEVGNEIQTDSVEFDIGFYAEQCRHNEDPENPFEEEPAQTATPQ